MMLEMREIRFFLAAAREKSFVRAAAVLYQTQPNLTRTIRALEEKLGGPLFIRSSKGVKLTPRGELLLRRATQISDLVEQTMREVSLPDSADETVVGDVHLAAGETVHMPKVIKVMKAVREHHPGIRFHVWSANGEEVARRVDLGLADIGLVFEPFDVTPYEHRRLPWDESWGLLIPRTHPLARRQGITQADLKALPLIVSNQMWAKNLFHGWYGRDIDELSVAASYNLIGTAKQMTAAGVGASLTFEGLVRHDPEIVFVPLQPPLRCSAYLIRRRGAAVTAPVRVFLDALAAMFEADGTVDDGRSQSKEAQ